MFGDFSKGGNSFCFFCICKAVFISQAPASWPLAPCVSALNLHSSWCSKEKRASYSHSVFEQRASDVISVFHHQTEAKDGVVYLRLGAQPSRRSCFCFWTSAWFNWVSFVCAGASCGSGGVSGCGAEGNCMDCRPFGKCVPHLDSIF